MAKLITFIALLLLLITTICNMPFAQSQAAGATPWANRVDTGKEVVTTLNFYFHDILSGGNPSAVSIVKPPQSSGFGQVMMVDDPLTIGPDPNSKLVGHARGFYASASKSELNLLMVMSYVFSDDIYGGSSFSLMSINQALNPVREMAIVGGTGLFRLARGYAIAQTYSLDPTTGDAVVGYNVTLSTYI